MRQYELTKPFSPYNLGGRGESIRDHWGIENSLHWVLDVEFDEDPSRVRKGESPENLAVVRLMAINLLKREKSVKSSTGKKRLKCCISNNYLGKILFGANKMRLPWGRRDNLERDFIKIMTLS